MLYNVERINAEALTAELITATTLNNQYKNVLDTTKNFNVTYSETKTDIDDVEYKHKTEHMINKATATFGKIQAYTEFQFETYLEKGKRLFKTPYVKVRIVDKTRPDRLALQVRTEYGYCGRSSYRYNVKFNDVNYTLTLAYNTRVNNIEINTYTDFDKYNYTSQMYQIPDKYEMESITYMGYTVYFFKQCYSNTTRYLSDVYTHEVEAKNYNESMIIVG